VLRFGRVQRTDRGVQGESPSNSSASATAMRGLQGRRGSAVVAVLLIHLLAAATGRAANISVNHGYQGATVTVDGRLLPGDGELFRNKISVLSTATIVLQSDGGSAVAGIQIGEAIRQKGFSSVVIGRCASACAIAWLGGTPRFMAPGAEIGFHAAYDSQSGQETGVGNALVGAYLNKIGLPYKAVIYITSAPPASMTWLTPSEATRRGIDVALFSGVVPQAPQRIPMPRIEPGLAPAQPAARPSSDCKVRIWFANRCGALALGSNGSGGADWASTPGDAANLAINLCRNYTTNCSVVRWVCSTAGFGAIAHSPSKGAYGYSANYLSRDAAEQRALEECNAR
jgi:hypothetical protein